MNKEINYEEIKKLNNPLLIDMRSETEHEGAKIIGSVNFPILNTEEHKNVSILYDSGEVLESKKEAVKYASDKLPEFFNFIADNAKEKDIVLYCSRGGYRSTAPFYLLNSLSMGVYKLKGGYKSYRKYIMKNLEEYSKNFKFINLNGYTGVGKTKILKELEKLGANVLNLEELASHRGSLLGNLEENIQPSQKDFEALIENKFESFSGKYVFVECESYKIGKLFVPKTLHDSYYNDGAQVLVTLPIDKRVENIKDEYVNYDEHFKKSLSKSLEDLSKFIGKKRVTMYKELIDNEEYEVIIEDLIKNYYDISYKLKNSGYDFTLDNSSPKESAKKLIEKFMQ